MASVYRTWADGDAFTAEDAGDYFMRQALIVCDNQTDRDAILTPNEGMHVYRKDTDAVEIYDGSAWLTFHSRWISWTPTWTNLTVGNAIQSCKYQQLGKTVTCRLSLVMGSTTVVGSDPTFTLPVTRAAYGGTANVTLLGSGHGYDTSANALFLLTVGNATTTTSSLRTYWTTGTHSYVDTVRSNNPLLWATGDEFGATFTYEAE